MIRTGFWGLLIVILVQYNPNLILIIEAPILNVSEEAACYVGALKTATSHFTSFWQTAS